MKHVLACAILIASIAVAGAAAGAAGGNAISPIAPGPAATPGNAAPATQPAPWLKLYADEDWYKSHADPEQVFTGTLEKLPQEGGIGIPMREHRYKLGTRGIYPGTERKPLEALVGKKVEIKGKPYDVHLEGQAVSEIWPGYVRPATPGSTTQPATAPAPRPVDPRAAAALIEKLADSSFEAREAASKKLAEMGEAVRPMLAEKAKEAGLDAEVAQRIGAILARLDELKADQDKATIIGKVVDEKGRPVAGATVTVRQGKDMPNMGTVVGRGVSLGDGTFAVRVAPGSFDNVSAELEGSSVTDISNWTVGKGKRLDVGNVEIGQIVRAPTRDCLLSTGFRISGAHAPPPLNAHGTRWSGSRLRFRMTHGRPRVTPNPKRRRWRTGGHGATRCSLPRGLWGAGRVRPDGDTPWLEDSDKAW